jgi:UDPglucose 6-dehydrogenase
MGYLGVTHAACMASLDFEVLGVDCDATKVARLNTGDPLIFEPGLADLMRSGLDSRRLSFTTEYERAAAFGDVHFVCVGTPQQRDGGGTDLAQLNACVAELAPRLTRPCLVVGKSTVPAGTAAAVAAELARIAPAGESAEVCWNPEFLREGHGINDTLHPDRIVVGVQSAHAEAVIRELYARQLRSGVPLFVTDMATAELAKVSANAFLATKISFINAVAEVCDATGADAPVLAEILGADPRIGAAFLRPGLGFGGGCLPKDLRALLAQATELGLGDSFSLLRAVDAINLSRRTLMVNLVSKAVGGSPAGKLICALGAAFKPGSDDVRDSPALDVAQILHGMGAEVTIYDPAAVANARRLCPELSYAKSAIGAAQGAHVVLLLTEWPEFVELDPCELGTVTAARIVVDGRYALDPDRWRQAGWQYHAVGIRAEQAAGVSISADS